MKAVLAPTIVLLFTTVFGKSLLYAVSDSLEDEDPVLGKWKVTHWSVDGREFDAKIGCVMEFSADGKLSTFDREDRTLRVSWFRIEGSDKVRRLRVDSIEHDGSKGNSRSLFWICKTEQKASMRLELVICINPFTETAPESIKSTECESGNLIVLEAIDEDCR